MKKIFCISLLTVATLLAMSGCGGGKKSTATSDADSVKTVLVKTERTVLESVPNTIEFTSNIKGYKENNIAPSMPVRIDNIYVEVGQAVGQGQLLAKMDPTQFNQTQVQLANLQADHDRIKAVYEAGGISKQQLEQSETSLKVQQEAYNNLKANIELRSPISGVVTARNFDPGDLYSGAMPVLTIMQINTLKVTVAVSEQYFPQVKLNMPAEIRVDMYADKVFSGKVSLITPAIDAATRTFEVEITIPNSSNELRPGMFSRTTLNFGSSEGIMAPDIAVQKQMGSNEKYVILNKNGKVEKRFVQTGRQIGNKINIVSGLEPGDEIVTSANGGIGRLENGMALSVENQ